MSEHEPSAFNRLLAGFMALALGLGLVGCAQPRGARADAQAWPQAQPIAAARQARTGQRTRVVVLLEPTGTTTALAHDLSGSLIARGLPADGTWRKQPARPWVVAGVLQRDAQNQPYLAVQQMTASEALPYGAHLCVHWTCGRWDEERWVWLGLNGQAYLLDRKSRMRKRWRVDRDKVRRVLSALQHARERPAGPPDPRGATYQFCWWTGEQWRSWQLSAQPDKWLHEVLVHADAWLQGPPGP